MHVCCPRCHQPVELVENAGLENIDCPSCGSAFDLHGDAPTGRQEQLEAEAVDAAREAPTLALAQGRTPSEAETIGRPTDAALVSKLAGRAFGEYELLAEVARGGMGVVFKARQKRLNRTVAVKMILAGELADQDDVRRFMTEAEAAAGLDHPGIVPVYESGEIDGQHFFSMGYVEGQGLAGLLAAGPLPPQRAAELVAQVSDAVDYAHERGVIHRDLKPGNILLDKQGHPRVTDFGLAKRVSGDSGLTRSGQALGTPSYMPPEQASGKLNAVGRPADVYALGAVLYAALTGRPPFQAATPLDTVLQVLEQEPVAPRQLNHNIPRDLDTIALKCLEKEPHKRYATAKELADELRRFLRGEPICARPIGRAKRAWRWCRRNPKVAVLTAAVFVLLTTVAVGSTVAFVRIDNARREADANLRKAERQQKLAERARQDALRHLAVAETERRHAESNFVTARDAVDRMLTRVGHERLSGVPQMEPVRRALLEDAVQFYRGFLDKKSDDPAVRAEMARAYQRLAEIYRTLGQNDSGRQAIVKGAEIFEALAKEYPEEPEYRAGAANGLNQLGSLLRDEMKATEGEQVYGHAAKILKKLVKDAPTDPRYRLMLSQTLGNLGLLREMTGSFDKAEEVYRQAMELDEDVIRRWPDRTEGRGSLSANCGNLERLLREMGRSADAEPLARRACELGEKMVADFPAQSAYQSSLASSYHNLGILLDETARRDEAERCFRKAIGLGQRLADDFPHIVGYREDLAKHYNSLGLVLSQVGYLPEAEAAFERAIALKQKLAADLPTVPLRRRELANSFANFGLFHKRYGHLDKADQAYRQGIDVLEELVREFPAVPEYQSALGAALNDFATVTGERDPKAARQLVQRAIECQQLAIDINPRDEKFHKFLRNHYLVLTRILLQLGEHADAASTAMTMAELSFDPAGDHYNAACYLARCVPLATKDSALPDAERAALAENYGRRAVEQLKLAIAAGYHDAEHIQQDSDLNAIRDRNEFRELLAGVYQRLIETAEKLDIEHPASGERRLELARLLHALGNLQRTRVEDEAAKANYLRAIEIAEKLAAEYAAVVEYRSQLARSYNSLGLLETDCGQRQALGHLERALEIRQSLAAEQPDDTRRLLELSGTQCNLGNALRRQGGLDAALERYALADAALERILAKTPAEPGARLFLRNTCWGRAETLMLLNRFAEATADWRRTIELNTVPETAVAFRLRLAESLARAGEHVAAAEEAAALAGSDRLSADELYPLASVLSVCVAAASGEGTLTDRYAGEALGLLQRAGALGFFNDSANVARFEQDFSGLLARDGFRTFSQQLSRRDSPGGEAQKVPERPSPQ